MQNDNTTSYDKSLLDLLGRQSFWPIEAPAPSPDEIEASVAAALSAPDHGKLHPARFLVIPPDRLADLGDLFVRAALAREPGKDHEHWRGKAQAAPLMLVLIARINRDHRKVTEREQRFAVGAAGMNVLNALHLMGYAAYWTTGVNATDATVSRDLGLAANEEIAGFLFVGSARQDAKIKQRSMPDNFLQQWNGLTGSN